MMTIILWLSLHLLSPSLTSGIGFELTVEDQSATPKAPVALSVDAIPGKTYCQFTAPGYAPVSLIVEGDKGRVTLLPPQGEQTAYQYSAEGLPFLLNMGIQQLGIDKEWQLLRSFLETSTVDPSGETMQRQGFTCEKIILRSTEGELIAWMAAELKGQSALMTRQWADLPYLKDIGALWSTLDAYGFPVQMTYKSNDGTLQGALRVSDIRQQIPQERFDLSSYTLQQQ